MWLTLDGVSNAVDDYLMRCGRSLLVCQNFESNCKDVLAFGGLSKLIKDEKIQELFDKEHSDLIEILCRMPLARSIIRLKEDLNISEKDIDILLKAKDSRNYIAHEVAVKGFYTKNTNDAMTGPLAKLFSHVKNVAKGDNIVSGWCYEIHEKEPAPNHIQELYVSKVLDWVFGKRKEDSI